MRGHAITESVLISFKGRIFGMLRVVRAYRKGRRIYCECECTCGARRISAWDGLLRGSPRSCRDCRLWRAANAATEEEMVGAVFGRLVVLPLDGSDHLGRRVWLVECECGGSRQAHTGQLRANQVKSCGQCGQGRGTWKRRK